MEFVLPSPRNLAIGFLVVAVGVMFLMATATVFTPTPTPTRPIPLQSSTPNVTAPDEIDYDDTGDSIEGIENEDLHHNDVQDFVLNTPPMDIEEAIRRTNANLAERGDPMLSEEEGCLARAVASGSDRSICNEI